MLKEDELFLSTVKKHKSDEDGQRVEPSDRSDPSNQEAVQRSLKSLMLMADRGVEEPENQEAYVTLRQNKIASVSNFLAEQPN